MGRRVCGALAAAIGVLVMAGCSVTKMEGEKIRDVEFTVMDQEEIPEEFLAEIEKKKEKEMMVYYGDGEYLYVARGYGEQETSGYSIQVAQCYETEEALCVETDLLGPAKGEEILEKKTYPYVVIRVEYIDKPVVYE